MCPTALPASRLAAQSVRIVHDEVNPLSRRAPPRTRRLQQYEAADSSLVSKRVYKSVEDAQN